MSPQGGFWPESLAEFRAVIVPELALLDGVHLERLREYARQGGRLIAFGHATLLDETGQPRKDYALSDVLGVQLAGEVVFPADAQRAAIKVDSEYNEAFGAHVLSGGAGEAWASAGTPMPHWVELTLPKAVEVVRVEVVNRQGPYQITDLEVEVGEGGQWKPFKSVTGAADREIVLGMTPAVRMEKLRVKILRELYQNQDRQYADVAAVRVLDSQGHDWVRGSASRIPLVFHDPKIGGLFGDPPSGWTPLAVRVQPTSARAVASLQPDDSAAAILTNRFANGEAYLVTAGDGCFERDDPFWKGLARLAAGEPTMIVSPEDAGRYRFILTRVADAHVLHVIDSQADLPGSPPRPVTVSLHAARLGNPRQAAQVGSDMPLQLTEQDGRISLTVKPDPIASIVLQ